VSFIPLAIAAVALLAGSAKSRQQA
jgi:hypothetical protein